MLGQWGIWSCQSPMLGTAADGQALASDLG